MTRSTVPMSMPSSSEAVATTARSSPCLEPRFGFEPQRSRRGCRDAAARRFRPSRLRQRMRDALGQPARVDEDERRSMRQDMARDAVVDLRPHLAGRHGAQFVVRNFDREVHFAAVADIDDRGIRARSNRDLFDGPHRGG